jgi:ubiquinol-cytochrome c reductase cytochrome c subunit
MKRALATVLLVGLVFGAGGARAQESPGAEGARLYAVNCSMCHGDRGQGIEPARPTSGGRIGLGPSLEQAGALAADFYLRTGYMPLLDPYRQPRRSRPSFTDAQIDALVAYVASFGSGPAIPEPHPENGSLSAGLRLFTEHCAGCHQVVGEGGFLTGGVAPPLEDATPAQIAEAVRIGPYLMPRFSETTLSDAELDSIIAYVEQAKQPDDRGGWGIGHVGPIPEGIVTWLIAAVVLVGTCVVIGRRGA